MDFILNIVSEPRKKKKQNEEKPDQQKVDAKEPVQHSTKYVSDAKPTRSEMKVKRKPIHSFITKPFRKRKLAIDVEEEPKTKLKKRVSGLKTSPGMDTIDEEEDDEAMFDDVHEEGGEEEEEEEESDAPMEMEEVHTSSENWRKKRKEKRKSDADAQKRQNKEHRQSAFNNLEALMSEPVEAKLETLFSDKRIADVTCLHPFIKSLLIEKLQLEVMTAIQMQCLGPLLEGRNALIKAQTGSGKTLAYALPIVQRLQAHEPPISRSSGPVALVIAPTRELVSQTQEVFERLLRPFVRIVSGALGGGIRKKPQKASLRKGLNVLVATPQRLLDHIRTTACLDLSRLQWLVIDEADRLLELGFERAIASILSHVTGSRAEDAGPLQTVLLSATLSEGVERLAGLALEAPVRLSVTEEEESAAIAMPVGLRHFVASVPAKKRLVLLAAFLLLKCRYSKASGKVIVFMATQDAVEFHYSLFSSTLACSAEDLILPNITSDMKIFRLHGSMANEARVSVFREFSSCEAGSVLLTTDVACRGLDVPRVAWVVQYHVPAKPVDYIHRVGRTARAGGSGKALLFLQPEEEDYLKVLAGLGVHTEELPMQDVLQAALVHANNIRRKGKKGRLLNDTELACSRLQFEFQRFLQTDGEVSLALAEQAFLSYLRFYASMSGEMRTIFRFKGLHLGHVARSFALRDAPKDIAKKVTGRTFGRAKEQTQSAKRTDSGAGHSRDSKKISDIGHRDMLAEFGL